ncbi:MAG: chemotaxis protein MotA, partial [Thermoleophilaceae bacterium]|nr:chemotaxis protein MotA [Thermoleophilaceae bacterium]
MKAITAIGIGLALGCLFMATMMEGTSPMAFFNIPSILIVFGGTLGVTIGGSSMENFKKVPALYKKALSADVHDLRARVGQLVGFAEKARRDGLLALDDELSTVDDEFMRRG